MAEKATVARPYARAAFEYAREHRLLADWSELLGAAATVAADPAAAALIANPRVRADELVKLIADVANDGGARVAAEGRNFLATLAHNRRLGFLPEIAAQYAALRAESEQTLDVEVTTAMALTPAQRTRLGAALTRRFARQVRLAETVDPALVGGAIVRAGDLVIDGSLESRLKRLEQQISRP
jgi:F-type H+-transporting ATPase subunit delta